MRLAARAEVDAQEAAGDFREGKVSRHILDRVNLEGLGGLIVRLTLIGAIILVVYILTSGGFQPALAGSASTSATLTGEAQAHAERVN